MSKQCPNNVQTVSKHCPSSVQTTCLNSFGLSLKCQVMSYFQVQLLPNYADTPIRHKIKGTRDFTVKMLCGKVSGRIAEYRQSLPTIEHEAEAMHVPQVPPLILPPPLLLPPTTAPPPPTTAPYYCPLLLPPLTTAP